MLPLVPPLALNIARIDFISKSSRFRFEANFAGVMCVLYLLGAYALYSQPDQSLHTSFYTGIFALIISSILCLYVFRARVSSRHKVSALALILVILAAQYLTIFSLSASGIIWNTNKELKALASSVNSVCKSGTYLYELPSKDLTILRFYLDDAYVLESLDDFSAVPRRCIVSTESSKKQILHDLSSHKISNFYFR